MIKSVNLGLGGGSLLQVANRSLNQMMSYIIDCPNGGCIVIDGGYYCSEDAENLYNLLLKRGKRVEYWFITHAHSDHLGALLYLMENKQFDIVIENLCFNFPSWEWLSKKEEADMNERFLKISQQKVKNIIILKTGEILAYGGISIEVLSVPDEYENYPNINSTSIILRVHFPLKDVLFLGDFDKYAEDEFLRKYGVIKLKCEIVQMSHHGQGGVTKRFYEFIQPKFCLYPTPKWLWENNRYKCNAPETVGKGPFTIMETRKWMEEIGAKESYTQLEGDCIFE